MGGQAARAGKIEGRVCDAGLSRGVLPKDLRGNLPEQDLMHLTASTQNSIKMTGFGPKMRSNFQYLLKSYFCNLTY